MNIPIGEIAIVIYIILILGLLILGLIYLFSYNKFKKKIKQKLEDMGTSRNPEALVERYNWLIEISYRNKDDPNYVAAKIKSYEEIWMRKH